ncbi:MAG: pilus assembly protein [Kiritimatiellae bacterium]|nr:pilus assembly protein [Kiritimatiellia bacterium]
MLMEAVLCLPLLLLLVTGIVQFARIWEARLFTQYAAYNAARAALVYNPADYADLSVPGRTVFHEHQGPVWQAAVNTLAWKSATENSSSSLLFPGFAPGDRVPDSAAIWGETTIFPGRSWESNGMVCVTVNFQFPLLFRIFDPSLLVSGGNESGDGDPMHSLNDFATVSLTESCVLPKPWSSAHYPRLSREESQTLADYQSWGALSGAPSIFGGKEAGE